MTPKPQFYRIEDPLKESARRYIDALKANHRARMAMAEAHGAMGYVSTAGFYEDQKEVVGLVVGDNPVLPEGWRYMRGQDTAIEPDPKARKHRAAFKAECAKLAAPGIDDLLKEITAVSGYGTGMGLYDGCCYTPRVVSIGDDCYLRSWLFPSKSPYNHPSLVPMKLGDVMNLMEMGGAA